MKKILFILILLGLSHFAIAQTGIIFWKQVGTKTYNFRDTAKVTDMRPATSFYRIQSNGKNFYIPDTMGIRSDDLGTGSASSSTYLRGDRTWGTPTGGGGSLWETDANNDLEPATSGSGDPAWEYDGNLDIEPKS